MKSNDESRYRGGEGKGEGGSSQRKLRPVKIEPSDERPIPSREEKPDRVPPPVPPGRKQGEIRPTNDPFEPQPTPTTGPPRGEDPVIFGQDTPVGELTPNANLVVDACGAESESAVMITGNLWCLFSGDGGASFKDVPLGNVFDMQARPGRHGLPAGDQVVIYIREIDRFAWLLLYYPEVVSATEEHSTYALALASPSDLTRSDGRSGWYVWEFDSTFLGLGDNSMDFPDLAITNQNLYISASSALGGFTNGYVVARIPIGQLSAPGTIDIGFTNLADSNGMTHGRLAQETRTAGIWTHHLDTNTLRVFDWADGNANFGWRDIDIQQWSLADYVSMTPPIPHSNPALRLPVNWLGAVFTSVAAGVRRRDELWLGWTAGRADGFPHPHARLVTLDINDWHVIGETQVWNPNHAWAYPWLAVNAREDLGISIGWGGGDIAFGNHAVGIPDDHVLWYSEPSDTAIARWGDYVCARGGVRNRSAFAGFGYTLRKDPASDAIAANPRFIRFGRQSVM